MGNPCSCEDHFTDRVIQKPTGDRVNWHLVLRDVEKTNEFDDFRQLDCASDMIESSDQAGVLSVYIKLTSVIRPKTVDHLLRCGCDINHQDGYGMSALHYAGRKHAPLAVFQVMIRDWGADVNLKNKSGRTALLIYLHVNFRVDRKIVKLFVRGGLRKDVYTEEEYALIEPFL